MSERVVIDASVGVKWLRTEAGSDAALRLLERHVAGEIELVVPGIFVHEVLDVTRRLFGVGTAARQWAGWLDAGIRVAGFDERLVRDALRLCDELGCTVYDAMAPALAERLETLLYSADRRAHGELGYARILG